MVAIARALLNDNRLLLVDEPTKGLAPALVAEVARVLERLAELTTVLLVEQNLGVVRRIAHDVDRPRPGPRRARGRREGAARRSPSSSSGCSSVAEPRMSTFLLLTITGLGLGAMYFLIASGLSLIYGLMGVLNFAHGAFITVGGYGTWWVADARLRRRRLDRSGAGSSARSSGSSSAALFAALVELVLIRPLYARHIEQVLVTVGLAARVRRARRAASGARTRSRSSCRRGCTRRRPSFGAHIPNDRWVEIATAVVVLALLAALPAARRATG